MKAHVLITNADTFPVCKDRLIWGIGTPDCPSTFGEWISPVNSRKPYLKMLVDMMGVTQGDLVFLYERRAGFHGVYRVVSPVFFDTENIFNSDNLSVGSQWPLRINLESVYYFPKPVPEDLLFSTPHYENVFWIWAYRKSQGPRGCNTITPEAGEALIELLVKVNGADENYSKFDAYIPPEPNFVKFQIARNGEKVSLEDFLRGYILANLQEGSNDLETIFGPKEDVEWYANNVPYHITQKNIDILMFHKNFRYTTIPLRYKYSVAELKRDIASPKDITQLLRYSTWVSGRLSAGEVEMVQPILIAHHFSEEAIKKSQNADFNERGIILVKYKALNDKEIEFAVIS